MKIIQNRYFRVIGLIFLLSTVYCLLSTPTASAQVMDRIQRGCGGLGGSLVQVITDFDGSVRIRTCTGGFVYICNSAGTCTQITPGGPTGSGTAGTLPIWTAPTVLGNSFATQLGNNFSVIGPTAGSILTVKNSTSTNSLIVDGTAGVVNLLGSTSASVRSGNTAGFQALATGISTMGDFLATTNNTTFAVSDSAQSYTFNKLISCGFLNTAANGRLQCQTGAPITGSGTVNTLAMFTPSGTAIGNSFATQSGNDFIVTPPANGRFTAGRPGALFRTDDAAGSAAMGDVTVAGNGTQVTVNDGAQTIDAIASTTAQITVSGTGVVSAGDVAGGGNSTNVAINDPAQTIIASTGAANYLVIDGSNTTVALGKANTDSQVMTNAGSGVTQIGDPAVAGNGTVVTVDDPGTSVTLRVPGGGGGGTTLVVSPSAYTLNKLPSCTLGIVTDAAGLLQCSATVPVAVFANTSTSLGGGALLAGGCVSNTTAVTGATTSMVAVASPNTYPGNGATWSAQVTAPDTVTTRVCAIIALTPTASTYNIRVIQ